MSVYEGLMRTEFGGTRLRDRSLQAKSRQKADEFEPIYLGKYRF